MSETITVQPASESAGQDLRFMKHAIVVLAQRYPAHCVRTNSLSMAFPMFLSKVYLVGDEVRIKIADEEWEVVLVKYPLEILSADGKTTKYFEG